MTEEPREDPSAFSEAETAPDTPAHRGVEPHEPARIGPYRILRRLGQGGMGTVYLARRDDEQVHRRVAIKVIRRGDDGEEILRRFHLERQLLAALSHPNIARLLDAAVAEDGRPYFVMEYIEGRAITAYCEEQRLTIPQRLKLFIQVCAAVHHAHQNLIVHRDLKPGNIHVTNDGVPKLLDFGIAKLLNPDLGPIGHAETITGGRVMTPQYASPEQVRGGPIAITSDVYSLGVLLYELLAGRRPYDLERRTAMEIERIVCEEDPVKPSTAVATTSRTATTDGPASDAARSRSIEPSRLRRSLAGDLDTIVMMAMRKEAQRRYQSVEQLADDVQRHLDGLPVRAHRDAVGYRAAKFVRRHRVGVGAAALVAISLVGGLVTTVFAASEAVEQRDVARDAQLQKQAALENEKRLRERADECLEQLFEYNRFLLLELQRGVESEGIVTTLEQQLPRAREALRTLREADLEDAALRRALADMHVALGDFQSGKRQGSLGDPRAALRSYEEALRLRHGLLTLDPDDADLQRAMAKTHLRLGDVAQRLGEIERAEPAYVECLRIARHLHRERPDDPEAERDLAVALAAVGDLRRRQGRPEEAMELFRQSLGLREALVADEGEASRQELRDLTTALVRMARTSEEQGDLDEARAMLERAIEIRARLATPLESTLRATRDLATARFFLGVHLLRRDEPEAALALLDQYCTTARELAEIDERIARAQRDLVVARQHRAEAMLALDEPEPRGALRDLREAARIAGALLREQPDDVGLVRRHGRTLWFTASAHEALGAPDEAESVLREAAELLEAAAAAHPDDPALADDAAQFRARLAPGPDVPGGP